MPNPEWQQRTEQQIIRFVDWVGARFWRKLLVAAILFVVLLVVVAFWGGDLADNMNRER